MQRLLMKVQVELEALLQYLDLLQKEAQAVKLPIIGMGGIMNAEDAIEMILAGATAVSVGTANFTDPSVTEKIVAGIEAYMEKYQVSDICELVGAVHER